MGAYLKPVLTRVRTGRDWSPRSLPQTHPNFASGIWDTLFLQELRTGIEVMKLEFGRDCAP